MEATLFQMKFLEIAALIEQENSKSELQPQTLLSLWDQIQTAFSDFRSAEPDLIKALRTLIQLKSLCCMAAKKKLPFPALPDRSNAYIMVGN